MEVFMRDVPFELDEGEVKRLMAPFLHGRGFEGLQGGAPFNFLVHLFKPKQYSLHKHRGCGVMVMPTKTIGERLLMLTEDGLSMKGRTVYFSRGKQDPKPEDVAFLTEPYQDPLDIEREKRQLEEVKGEIDLTALQFGWPLRNNAVSVEWTNPETPQITVELDSQTHTLTIRPDSRHLVVIQLNSVQSAILDASACVLWLERPATIEREKFDKNSTEYLDYAFTSMSTALRKTGPTRDRMITLDPESKNLFAYLRVVRITFGNRFSYLEFQKKARLAGLRMHAEKVHIINDSEQRQFAPQVINTFDRWLEDLPFTVAFQLDALISRRRFSPKELLTVKNIIDGITNHLGSQTACESIRLLESRRDEDPRLPINELLGDILTDFGRLRVKGPLRQMEGTEVFYCHRVTVTPTSLVLSGPLPDETNRVLRRYIRHQNNFIRVEFREEDRLHLRLDREVDSAKFIDERVGSILRNGLVIAGRRFEFLAYSSSALKEHATWFVSPFVDDDRKWVNGESIRQSLGNFENVIHCPARYGARIAQAFSTTESSITVDKRNIDDIEDKKSPSGILFTDGVGTMSSEIADQIWDGLTETRSKRSRRHLATPSAFQIRLGGIKGMLSVDGRLDGRVICMRPSMRKFTAKDMEVEIARAFDRPMLMYLNRFLIMLLETLGVPLEPILQLQRDAVQRTEEASLSMDSAARMLEQHGLGTSFHMTSIMLNLHKLGIDLESTARDGGYTLFLQGVLKFSVNHVLRDLKYRARIPVPDAWTLVGVADEFDYLKEDQVYACVRPVDGKHQYLQGPVLISRSPTTHPGDARMVWAIGQPPRSAPAALKRLVNCVVFSCQGERPLPSKLAGGDLDGDIFCLIMDQTLHPKYQCEPSTYKASPLVKLDRPASVSDIAQFVTDFIKSDILGLIANQILLTADISPDCLLDESCIQLAELHSHAVDYPKTGHAVVFSSLPKPKSKRKPDWVATETSRKRNDYYPSNRHIGHLFRDIRLPAIPEAKQAPHRRRRHVDIETDTGELDVVLDILIDDGNFLSRRMKRRLEEFIDIDLHINGAIENEIVEMVDLFKRYARELKHICWAHKLGWSPLTEEEIVAGTITAKCSQPRMRSDTISDMRRVSSGLVTITKEEMEGEEDNSHEDKVLRSWTAWKVALAMADDFGARSFGLIALDGILTNTRKIEISEP